MNAVDFATNSTIDFVGSQRVMNSSVVEPYLYPCLVKTPGSVLTSTFANESLDLANQLEAIKHLDDNWDGFGAPAITTEVQMNGKLMATRLLSMGIPSPDVVPTNSGTISLEWNLDEGRAYLEVGKTRFSFVMHADSGAVALADGIVQSSDLSKMHFISAFMAKSSPLGNLASPVTFAFRANVV